MLVKPSSLSGRADAPVRAGEQVGVKMSIFPLRWQSQALNTLQNTFSSPAQAMQPPVGRRVGNATYIPGTD